MLTSIRTGMPLVEHAEHAVVVLDGNRGRRHLAAPWDRGCRRSPGRSCRRPPAASATTGRCRRQTVSLSEPRSSSAATPSVTKNCAHLRECLRTVAAGPRGLAPASEASAPLPVLRRSCAGRSDRRAGGPRRAGCGSTILPRSCAVVLREVRLGRMSTRMTSPVTGPLVDGEYVRG